MGGLAAITTPALQVVDHPTWHCPGARGIHPTGLQCCPCDHGLGGCCLCEPSADPVGTHGHECVVTGGVATANG